LLQNHATNAINLAAQYMATVEVAVETAYKHGTARALQRPDRTAKSADVVHPFHQPMFCNDAQQAQMPLLLCRIV